MVFERFVEIGRAVLINYGADAGKLAVIVDVLDHNRALIDGPDFGVKRQIISFRRLSLTGLKVEKLPRSAGTKTVKKVLDAANLAEKWAKTAWAIKISKQQRRDTLNDFERFSVMRLRKQKRAAVGKAVNAAAKEQK